MKLTLTQQQAERAVRDYLADPDEDAVAIRIPDDMPIRVSVARGGGLTVWAGEDAARQQKKASVAPANAATTEEVPLPPPPPPAKSIFGNLRGEGGPEGNVG